MLRNLRGRRTYPVTMLGKNPEQIQTLFLGNISGFPVAVIFYPQALPCKFYIVASYADWSLTSYLINSEKHSDLSFFYKITSFGPQTVPVVQISFTTIRAINPC